MSGGFRTWMKNARAVADEIALLKTFGGVDILVCPCG
jgi:hypothetical protein